MLEDVRPELQIERAAHHADFVLEDDEHARQNVMGPRHEVCWIWGDDSASEQDAALAGSGPDTAAAQQVSAPQAAVNALLSDPALPTDRLVLEVDIKTCTILALSPGVECFYKQSPFGDMRGQIFASFVHGKDLPILLGLLDGGGGTAEQIRVLHCSKQFSRGREIKGAAHEQISSGSVPRGTSPNEGCDRAARRRRDQRIQVLTRIPEQRGFPKWNSGQRSAWQSMSRAWQTLDSGHHIMRTQCCARTLTARRCWP